MRSKVSIVGVGNVGASCALWLAKRGIADLVLVDIAAAKSMPAGKGLDLQQAAPIERFNVRIRGNADGSYDGTENSDLVIITGGLPRKPGMSREDLVGANQQVIVDVLDKALPLSPNAAYIIVTNPLDTMTYLAAKHSGLPRSRVAASRSAGQDRRAHAQRRRRDRQFVGHLGLLRARSRIG
jgi:malate dehydrogenase